MPRQSLNGGESRFALCRFFGRGRRSQSGSTSIKSALTAVFPDLCLCYRFHYRAGKLGALRANNNPRFNWLCVLNRDMSNLDVLDIECSLLRRRGLREGRLFFGSDKTRGRIVAFPAKMVIEFATVGCKGCPLFGM